MVLKHFDLSLSFDNTSLEKDMLAKGLKSDAQRLCCIGGLVAKTSPTSLTRKTSQVPKEQRFLSKLLEQMNDDN